MVDFNNETTVGTPAANVAKLLLLEARYNAFVAIEFHNNKVSSGINKEQAILRARLGTLFLELQPYLERSEPKEEQKRYIKEVKDSLFFSKKDLQPGKIIEVIEYLNKAVDRMKITRLDTKQQFDTTDVEKDNEMNDY